MLITALKNAYRTQYPNQPYTEDVSQKIESAIHNKVEAESTADLLVENCDQMVSELDSLDSYWAVPREQQTITPEQMLVLKHAEPPHLTFF